VIQFRAQHALCEQLLELARQAGLAQNRFGILVLDLRQQLVDQFDRDEARCFLFSWFFGGHGFGHGISLSVLFHDPSHTKNLTRSLRVKDIAQGRSVLHRAIVMQQKTRRPVQFEITEQTRQSLIAWIDQQKLTSGQFLFPSRVTGSPHLSTRQYARIVTKWVASIGLDATAYGTHSLRRTKATLIYRRTKNIRAVQLLLGHTKLESTVRYLGIEVDDALEIAEQTEV
jgi:hypothetical protein